MRERLLDMVAEQLGEDRLEIRRRNLYRDDELPVAMVTGPTLAGISIADTMGRAAEAISYDALAVEVDAARSAQRLLGIGFANFIEPAPGPSNFAEAAGMPKQQERASARLEPDGSLTITTAQAPHGQSHETTLAQVAADTMGVPFKNVRIAHSDTRVSPFSLFGTAGSRAAPLAGGAVMLATRALRDKVANAAALLFDVPSDEIEIVDGIVGVRGDEALTFPLSELAMMAYMGRGMFPPDADMEMHATVDFDGGEGGWSGGTHACLVEVDTETGIVTVKRYVVVEDCGVIINPRIVDGQIRGGVAQGIGSVLYERATYDADGQFVAGNFMDYLLPTIAEVPHIEIHHVGRETNPMGFRGVGESGMIAAPAALTNAIAHALRGHGVTLTEQYLPPNRILELLGVA